MFTGIVEKTAVVVGIADGPGFRRLTVALNLENLRLGQSIAVNGCCLTLAEILGKDAAFDVVKETLDKTNLDNLKIGDRVNIEQSLKTGDRLDGHFVQGHVDGRATLINIATDPAESRLILKAPHELAKYLVAKGSVAIDGVSLTIAAVRDNTFEVALIPTTLSLTTLGNKSVGYTFNLETDILSKTVISWLERQQNRISTDVSPQESP